MKKSKYAKRRLCALLIFILVILFFVFIIFKIGNKKVNENISLLLNNDFYNTVYNVLVDDERNIFISKEDIKNIFDDTLYYNSAEKELITAYNTHVASIKLDSNEIILNGDNKKINVNMKEVNGIVYVPISELTEIYDIEITYVEKNKIVIIDSLLEKKETGNISEKIFLKSGNFLFSKKTEELNVGSEVFIIGTYGKNKKVRTSLGNVGFVNSNKIVNYQIVRKKEEDKKYNIVIYNNYSNISGIYENFSVDVKKQNFVIPTFFYLDVNSKILDKTSSSTAVYANYRKWLEENKLGILATFENNENVSNTLLTFDNRKDVINKICDKLEKYKFDGINVNFKTIDDINSFYRFIIELKPILKSKGLILSVTVNRFLDESKIENIVDYVIK